MTSSESDPLPVGLLCSSFQLPSSAAVCWEYPLPGTAPVLLLSGPSLLTSSFCTHCGAPGSDSAHFPGLGWPRCAPVPRTLTVHPTSLCPAPLGKQSGQASRAPFGAPWRLHLEFRSLCAKPSVLEVCPSSHAWGCEWGGANPLLPRSVTPVGSWPNPPWTVGSPLGQWLCWLWVALSPPETGVPLARLGPSWGLLV